MFAHAPTLRFFDPLAKLLGYGDGVFHYTFDDAVRLAGHACPTVAGAFLLVAGAVARLYGPGETPQRGALAITVHGGVTEGVNGPISQVFTLLTGAAAENGFAGFGGHHRRRGLLTFQPPTAPTGGPVRFTFTRLPGGGTVTLIYDPTPFSPDPEMARVQGAALAGDETAAHRFGQLWRQRVAAILADGGARTVREV